MENFKNKLTEEVLGKEMNFKQMDAAVATIPDRYEVETTVALSAILYSHLIAFGFYKGDEAVDVVSKLLNEFSSYELSELAKETIGFEIVEYYKDLAFANHALTEGMLSKAIIESAKQMEDGYENMEQLMAEMSLKIEKEELDKE